MLYPTASINCFPSSPFNTSHISCASEYKNGIWITFNSGISSDIEDIETLEKELNETNYDDDDDFGYDDKEESSKGSRKNRDRERSREREERERRIKKQKRGVSVAGSIIALIIGAAVLIAVILVVGKAAGLIGDSKDSSLDQQNQQAQVTQAQAAAQQAQVNSAALMASVELGIDAKTIPYVLKMVDLSQVVGQDGKINDEILKAALNKVLEDVPGLKPQAAGTTGFVQVGAASSNGGAGQAQQATQTQQAVPTKRWNRFNN